MPAAKKKTVAKRQNSRPAVRAGGVSKHPFSFSKSNLTVFAVIFAIAGVALIVASFAASPTGGGGGKKTTNSSPLSLTALQITNNPNSPSWCDNEDDVHDYQGTGSLQGTLSDTQQFCGDDFYNNVYWDAGGEGIGLDALSAGPLTDMTITAPGGSVHHAVLIGTTTSKGVTTYHYQTCYVPLYSRSTDTGSAPLAGGTWTYAITGNVPKVTYTVRVDMTDVQFQQAHCPPSQQNLTS